MDSDKSDLGPKLAVEFIESVQVKKRVIENEIPVLESIAWAMLEALRRENKIILFGNGGSAADAQHLAAELVGRFKLNRNALPAIALTTDTSILTAVANDYGFEYVFSRQIEAIGQSGDVAIAISTSGNSPNVLKAVGLAKDKGMVTIGFTGEPGGQLKDCTDLCFRVPSQSTPRIQEVHITAAHALCNLIEQALCQDDA